MKIIISDSTMMHGGAERVIANLSNRLIQLGHEVELLLFYDRPIWYELDERIRITIDEKYIGKASILRHMLWRRKYLKRVKPDVVLSFLAPYNMVNIVSLLGTPIPLIVADRNDPRFVPEKKVIRWLRDFLYKFADGIVLQSNNNKAYFSKDIQKKSTVILNAVDVGEYRGSAVHSIKNKEIVSVGRLIQQKNPWMLLEAFSNIHEKYNDYKLVYYGEGELLEPLKSKAIEYGISERVEFRGAVSDVFERLRVSELFVMSSEYEGMPNALLEAMCIGVPVISTKVSGAVDVIENDINGILVDRNDVKQLTRAMERMLSNPEFRKTCACSAVNLADTLESDIIADQWISFISRIKRGKHE